MKDRDSNDAGCRKDGMVVGRGGMVKEDGEGK
jgi:hypothetical protein